MFGHRFFGARYFGARYWGPAEGAAPPAALVGSRGRRGRAPLWRLVDGKRVFDAASVKEERDYINRLAQAGEIADLLVEQRMLLQAAADATQAQTGQLRQLVALAKRRIAEMDEEETLVLIL